MNWLDLFDDDAEADRKFSRERARVQLSDVCDDDDTVIAPYVGMMPDESNKEDGSPLDFGKPHNAHTAQDLSFQLSVLNSQIDRDWERALREGSPFVSLDTGVARARIEPGNTLNSGNTSPEAVAMHERAYWGMSPKSYL